MTPDQYRREGFRLGIEAAARIVENGYRCRSCGQVFLGNSGHSDADCSAGYPDWGSATDADKATAIRAIDVDEVLAGLPPVPDAVARLMKAARALVENDVFWDREYLSADLNEKLDALRAALAAMESDHD